jgi:hypothetical protein
MLGANVEGKIFGRRLYSLGWLPAGKSEGRKGSPRRGLEGSAHFLSFTLAVRKAFSGNRVLHHLDVTRSSSPRLALRPSFRVHVIHVLLMSPSSKVRWIYAWRVVAGVADE